MSNGPLFPSLILQKRPNLPKHNQYEYKIKTILYNDQYPILG